MKSIAVALAFVAAASAQLAGLADCANTCVVKFTTGQLIAGCKQGDIECVCKNNEFLDGIACCLSKDCSEGDQKKAMAYAKGVCTGAGVTVPDAVVCKSPTLAGPSPTGGPSETQSNGASIAAQSTSTTPIPGTTGISSPGTTESQGGDLTRSDKISLGVGIGIGLPATMATIWICVKGR